MPEYKGGLRSEVPNKVIMYGVDANGTEQPIATDGSGLKSYEDVATWSITTTADNLAATVTKAAEAGLSHYVTSVAGSYSNAAIGLLTVKDGAAIIGNYHAHDQRDVSLSRPLRITENSVLEVSLAASGTAGIIGAVTVTGYTV